MNGREVFKFATRVMVSSAEAVLEQCGKTIDDVDVYVPHQANKRIIDYAVGKLGIPPERTVVNVDRYGNTSSGSIPLALADARARGEPDGRRARVDDGHGRRPHVGLGADRMERRRRRSEPERAEEDRMGKIAFCFPGQGALEAGMGRELAEAVPAAMEVYGVGSEASGLDLQKLCFDSPLEDLVETEVQQPALVATCLAILAAIREARARARRRRRPLGRRVLGARLGRGDRDARGDRARARARPCDGRGRPRAPGLDGRDPGSRGRGGRDAVQEDPRRLAGELQLPRPDRHLR